MASASDHPASRPARKRALLRRLLPFVLALATLAALDRLAQYGAEGWVFSGLRASADAAAKLRVAVLQSEIEKQRTLPVVLAQDPDLRTALATKDGSRLAALSEKLEALSAGTRAAVIYLLDANGLAIAASNWQSPASFVGNDYAFRPYFRLALSNGSAEHYAFGTVSRRPGLYLARRLDGSAGPLGVIVVKAEFEAIEADWRRFAEPTFVTDERAIVLVTSEPTWRFRATAPIPPDTRSEIRSSLQYGDAPLDVLPIHRSDTATGAVAAQLPGEAGERSFVLSSVGVPTTSWTLHVLAPTKEAIVLAATAWRAMALLVGVIGLGLIFIWISRRRRHEAERDRQASAREELEARVRVRTEELQAANGRLRAEAEERRRAQMAMQNLQDELVQSSKLAVLGQIAASVAHEINQPVAAIRTYAENSEKLLAGGDLSTTKSNLTTITALSDRIGVITQELRTFARKTPEKVEAVPLRAAIDGALLLVGHRLRQQSIALTVDLDHPDAVVLAERIRLEQVFVNLLQNAAEALSGREKGEISIKSATTAGHVTTTIADNGPGLPDAVMRSLFIPFTTTKPTGLGLGLVISHDIVAEFGGTFTAENTGAGACLSITLPRAV